MNKLLLYIRSLAIRIIGCRLSTKWIIIWFWIELQRLALIPILSSNVNPRSIEASTKYFLFQAARRVILLLGILLRHYKSENLLIKGSYGVIELTIMLFALTIKIGIFPKHYWFVDVMKGVKFSRGFFVGIVSKIIPLYVIISIAKSSSFFLLRIIGAFSVLIGSILGVQQTQLRKLIALSSIAHLGWIIIVLSRKEKFWIGMLLFSFYVIMTLPLFWLGNLFSIEHLSKTTKITKKNIFGIILIIRLLSMAGLPPLLGFFYKWLMFYKIIHVQRYIIIGLLILSRLLSLYFYIQIRIRFYINKWPSIKILFYKNFNKIKWEIYVLIIITSNILIYLLLWAISPLSTVINL